MTLDLTEDEARALVQLLRRTVDFDPYPHASLLDPLKAILAKLEPASAEARTTAAFAAQQAPFLHEG